MKEKTFSWNTRPAERGCAHTFLRNFQLLERNFFLFVFFRRRFAYDELLGHDVVIDGAVAADVPEQHAAGGGAYLVAAVFDG